MTESIPLFAKLLSYIKAPFLWAWALFNGRTQIAIEPFTCTIEMPQRGSRDLWVAHPRTGRGLALFSIKSTRADKILLNKIVVAYSSPLSLHPLSEDSFFGGSSIGDSNEFPFQLAWCSPYNNEFEIPPARRLILGFEVDFGGAEAREIEITVTARAYTEKLGGEVAAHTKRVSRKRFILRKGTPNLDSSEPVDEYVFTAQPALALSSSHVRGIAVIHRIGENGEAMTERAGYP